MIELLGAIRNNAIWCDAVCRAHGLPTDFTVRTWSSPVRTPRFYPDAVTLRPFASVHDVLSTIDTSTPGASVKDSFATLDLGPHGLSELFRAQWTYRPVSAGAASGAEPMSRVDDATRFELPAALVADQDVALFAGPTGQAIANLGPPGMVGLSNVTGDDPWPAAIAAVTQMWPGLPLVGYEHGDDLTAALAAGFEPVGELIVWAAS